MLRSKRGTGSTAMMANNSCPGVENGESYQESHPCSYSFGIRWKQQVVMVSWVQADAMNKDLVVARPAIWQVSDGLRCRILGMRKFVVCFSSD